MNRLKQLVCLAALALPFSGCGVMQSMMTKSVDETAGARVLAFEGTHAVKRLGADGNAFVVMLKVGESLKTADLVVGSDDEQSQLLLALSAGNLAHLSAADFVLRSPMGEDTDVFVSTVEMGRIVLSLKGDAAEQFNFVDTNKSTLTVHPPAEVYLAIDDDTLDVFVQSGSAQVKNSRTSLGVSVPAGEGRRIAEGKAQPWTAPEGLNWAIAPSAPVAGGVL